MTTRVPAAKNLSGVIASEAKQSPSTLQGPRFLRVAPPYSLQRTLACGQVFRWRCEGPVAAGIFGGRAVRLMQVADGIQVEGLDHEDQFVRLRHYLGVDEPLEAIEAELHRDPVMRRVLPHTSGIALLRQDPWECLVSFIISAFNNIPKIEMSLDRLARSLGERLGESAWAFPGPARLAMATRAQLRRCLLGYRAPYVKAVARLVASGEIDLVALGGLPYDEARAKVITLPGVGEKVADCVLLFAYGKTEAFPVDVWVKRAVERSYFSGRKKTERQIRAFAGDCFGRLAGYAQQHLFYYARTAGRERARGSS